MTMPLPPGSCPLPRRASMARLSSGNWSRIPSRSPVNAARFARVSDTGRMT
jgi:hypothetical protein